jgi:hypothetical protein
MARRFWVGRAYRARHERRGLGPAACSAQALKRAIAERSASARRRRSLNSIGALLARCRRPSPRASGCPAGGRSALEHIRRGHSPGSNIQGSLTAAYEGLRRFSGSAATVVPTNGTNIAKPRPTDAQFQDGPSYACLARELPERRTAFCGATGQPDNARNCQLESLSAKSCDRPRA